MTDPQTGVHSSEADRELNGDPELLSALIEFSAAAGHEINNPLAVILGRVQLLLQQEADSSRKQALATIAGQARRIRDMIGDVMLFADPPHPEPQSVSLKQICDPILESMAEYSQTINTGTPPELMVHVPADFTVVADPNQLATVISELLRNAVHPFVSADRVELAASYAESGQTHCLITIRDNGRGFSATQATHAFDPFFSGRQAGRGLGFGLCKAWRLAELNSAQLRVKTKPATVNLKPDQFRTTFELRWPVLAQSNDESKRQK